MAGAVDESLEIAFEVSPAPLQTAEAPVHAGTVAMDDAGERLPQKFFEDIGGATGAAGEQSKAGRHKGPDPGFRRTFLGRRFVNMRRGLEGQLLGQLVVGGLDRLGSAVLQQHQVSRTGGLIQNGAQELGRPPLGLSKAGHQQGSEGDELRASLAGRHTVGKFRTSAATARADQAMALILGDVRLDLGKFPDLMTQRFGIDTGERLATTATLGGDEGNHLLTLFWWNQRSFVFIVSGLAAALTLNEHEPEKRGGDQRQMSKILNASGSADMPVILPASMGRLA